MSEPSIEDVMRAKDVMDSQPVPDKSMFYMDGEFYAFDNGKVEIVQPEQIVRD